MNNHLKSFLITLSFCVSSAFSMQQEPINLIQAARYGNIEAVRELINAGADLNKQDQDLSTALILASQNGHTEVVDLLIRAGANLNILDRWEKTALNYASEKGYTEIVNILTN